MTTAAPDLSCTIAGVQFPNPIVLASGIIGTHASLMERAARAGAGGVTSKSAGPVPRRGHVNPTCIDWGPGLLNAIGLANPGAEAEVWLLRETRQRLASLGVPLIASLFADTVSNFARVAETIALAEPDLIEIDMSCPNTASDLGQPFGVDCDSAADATRAVVGATQIPVIAKLAPNVPDLGLIAQAVVDAGAQAITAINTMPGMVIDVEAGQPVLSNRVGGVSGPALKAIAVYCVYEVRRAVDVPIIGTGGVSSGGDAVEMLMAGATAVGVGSAVYYRGVEALGDIVAELAGWLQDHAYDSVAQVRDLAHQPRHWSFSASPPPVPEV